MSKTTLYNDLLKIDHKLYSLNKYCDEPHSYTMYLGDLIGCEMLFCKIIRCDED